MSGSGHGIGAEAPGSWSFGGDVADVFDDHITSSVPGYALLHELVVRATDTFLHEESIVIDIGCSTGTLINKIDQRHSGLKNLRLIGVDTEEPMIRKSKSRVEGNRPEFIHSDFVDCDFEGVSFISSVFTGQFVRPANRQIFLDRIYKSLEWGGAFCFAEKMRGSDARFQDILTSIYWDWKLDQGFSESELISKWKSLKGVMEPFSFQGNLDMLSRAGFKDVDLIWCAGPFRCLLAIK